MTILFHVTLMTMLRHFEGVILALAERGHRVRVALPNRRPDLQPPPALTGHASISFVTAPAYRGDAWAHPIHELRTLRDYLRYLHARYLFCGREEKTNYATSTRPWEREARLVASGNWGAIYDLETVPAAPRQ